MNSFITHIPTTIFVCIITIYSPLVSAMDVVKLLAPQAGFDKKEAHKDAVIERALEITTPEFGAYKIEKTSKSAVSGRALKMMQDGDIVNLSIRIANEEWHQNAIPIKIPIRFGVNSYRLLMVNKKDLDKFSQIQTLKQLKEIPVGLGRDWSISKVFRANDFETIESSNFEGTFLMLEHQRFGYIPRGINEIFEELRIRKDKLSHVTIEPKLALEIKLATYIYVSSKHPRLAKRMEAGLRLMLTNGELRQLFDDYYLEEIQHANMHSRRVIKIANPLFVDKELLDNPIYWLSPNDL